VESHEFVCLIRSTVNARRLLRNISRFGRRGEVTAEEKKVVEEEVDELAQSLRGYATEMSESNYKDKSVSRSESIQRINIRVPKACRA